MRRAEVERITGETSVKVVLELDGSGKGEISTGIGFLDHMLNLFARHGFLDLTVQACGDLEVDCHHTVEDIGICIGQAFKQALGDKAGIRRYGSVAIPMDETLMLAAIDFSGRAWLNMDVQFTVSRLGTMDTEMFQEFFYAFAVNAGMNLHLKQLSGSNNHHIAESMFKALGQAVDQAVTLDPRIQGVRSTKGVL